MLIRNGGELPAPGCAPMEVARRRSRRFRHPTLEHAHGSTGGGPRTCRAFIFSVQGCPLAAFACDPVNVVSEHVDPLLAMCPVLPDRQARDTELPCDLLDAWHLVVAMVFGVQLPLGEGPVLMCPLPSDGEGDDVSAACFSVRSVGLALAIGLRLRPCLAISHRLALTPRRDGLRADPEVPAQRHGRSLPLSGSFFA